MSIHSYLIVFMISGVTFKAKINECRDALDAKDLFMTDFKYDKIMEIKFWDGQETYDVEN